LGGSAEAGRRHIKDGFAVAPVAPENLPEITVADSDPKIADLRGGHGQAAK
jgi:hypothetical protein